MLKSTINLFLSMKREGHKIVALTAYDYTTTQVLDKAGVDILLVGDSLGMVKLGHPSTLPVTVEDIVYHTRIVARARPRALLVADMPYMSYHVSKEEAIKNAGKMLKAGAEAVKLEGGVSSAPTVRAMRSVGIPVMGHIGMTPQSVHVFGGYKVQGKTPKARRQLLADAKALEQAGAFAIVLECIPKEVARQITKAVKIPTIGIGAGVDCDGQILVIDDLLGLSAPPHPRFVKAYASMRAGMARAAHEFARDVRARRFPDSQHSYD